MHTAIDPIELFRQAGPIVRGVIVLLIVLSVWCWAVIANASIGLWRLKRAIAQPEQSSTASLGAIWRSAAEEAAVDYDHETLGERRSRIQAAMRRRAQERIERAQGGLANLAVIASVAPFIGLFGTVWGIMTSFVGIAAAKDTSLAVVAPGIAEALGATAIGLAAAIPAAFAYNRLAASFGRAGRALNRRIEEAVPTLARAPGTGATGPTRLREAG